MFITILLEWLSRSRIFLLTSVLAIYGYSSFSQNEFGYEVYDSVKVDLKNGLLVDRYLPFDVPFYMIGDADSLESIELSIIEADQHACCVDFLDPESHETADTSCDCPCESKAEQKLRFYQTVMKIEHQRRSVAMSKSGSDRADAQRELSQLMEGIFDSLYLDNRFIDEIATFESQNVNIYTELKDELDSLNRLHGTWLYQALRLNRRISSDDTFQIEDIGRLLGIIHGSYVILTRMVTASDRLLFLNVENMSGDNRSIGDLERLTDRLNERRNALEITVQIVRRHLKSNEVFYAKKLNNKIERINDLNKKVNNLSNSNKPKKVIKKTNRLRTAKIKTARLDETCQAVINHFTLADSIKIIIGQIEVLQQQQDYLNGEVDYIRKVESDKLDDSKAVLIEQQLNDQIEDGYSTWFRAINSVYHPIDTLLQSRKILLQNLKREKAFQDEFYKKHRKRWEIYVGEMCDEIRKNRALICEDCEFSPNRCNYICGWKTNPVLSSDKFVLAIPPLRANKSYRFFFTISRRSDSNENVNIKKVLAQNLLIRIDSVFEGLIDIHSKMAADIQKVRSDLLNTSKYLKADLKNINKKIIWYLKDEYGDVEIDVKDLAFNDEEAARKLLNRLISHKYYHIGLDTIHRYHLKRNSPKKDPAWRSIIESPFIKYLNQSPQGKYKFINHSYPYEDRKLTFFKAKRMDEFFLLDTLNLIERTNSLLRQPPNADVPSGLLPYSNLQSVNLRKLETIRDFDPRTSQEYLNNLEGYKKYLEKVQSFVLDTLVRGKRDLRLGLFISSRYPNDPSVTQRERGSVDSKIIEKLHEFSDAIFQHEINIREAIKVYQNYQANLDSLNKQVVKVVDSVLNNNRKVQLAVLKNIGGITSANFQTRTEWYVSADVGVAYIPFGVKTVVPYFGANFNIAPINRQAHYSLFKRRRPKNSKTSYLWEDPPKLNRLYKALSLVVGLTTTDLSQENERNNLIGDNLNLLVGGGLRLTDAVRISLGAFITKKVNENPTIDKEKLGCYPYVSLSFDVDVIGALGAVGKLLFPGQ